MARMEKILKVSKSTKPDVYSGGKLQVFYTFETDGIPGHNLYRDIAAYQIKGKLKVGAFAKHVGNGMLSPKEILWQITNENTK